MTSATGTPTTGTPTRERRIERPAISEDSKKIRSELSRIERELESTEFTDSAKMDELARDLRRLDSTIDSAREHASRREKKLFTSYEREVDINKKTIDHMRLDAMPYSDAVVLAEGEVGGYTRGKGWQIAAITGGVLAVGALAGLAYMGLRGDSDAAITEGDILPTKTAYQGSDPTIIPPLDATVIAPTEIQRILRSEPYDLDPQIFARDVLPDLDPRLQNYLVPIEDVDILFDDTLTRENPEITNVRIIADSLGGMQIRFDGERVTEEGAIQPYIGRPQALLDSQAYAILTKYPGVIE